MFVPLFVVFDFCFALFWVELYIEDVVPSIVVMGLPAFVEKDPVGVAILKFKVRSILPSLRPIVYITSPDTISRIFKRPQGPFFLLVLNQLL